MFLLSEVFEHRTTRSTFLCLTEEVWHRQGRAYTEHQGCPLYFFFFYHVSSCFSSNTIKSNHYDTQRTVLTYRGQHVRHITNKCICKRREQGVRCYSNSECLYLSCATVTISLQKALYVTF